MISKKNTFHIALVTIVVLFIPLVAMQFSDEVKWDVVDFIAAGTLLVFFGYVYKILTKSSNSKKRNAITGVIVFTSLIIVWAGIAVD